MIKNTSEYRAMLADLRSLERRIGRLRRQLLAAGISSNEATQAMKAQIDEWNIRKLEIADFEHRNRIRHR